MLGENIFLYCSKEKGGEINFIFEFYEDEKSDKE